MPDLADLYPGYASHWIDTAAGKIFARVGGSGPPLESFNVGPLAAGASTSGSLTVTLPTDPPNGFTATGLPLSLQICCRPYEEATALRIGWAYEQATDWHARHPPGLE